MDSLNGDNDTTRSKSRKDYQAEITSLKKQAKSNKKNKKDLLLEISRLEKEFSEAFSEEKCSNTTSVHENQSEEQLNQKVSRAQKRREKKILHEKERNQRIEEQDEINKEGSRNKEYVAIKALLKKRGLSIYDVPSNGDCLYKAVEHQLLLNNVINISANQLRKNTSDYMRNNMADFLPFMSNTETGDLLSDSEFEDYCMKVESTSMWGGQIELKALSNVLKMTIEILQAEGPPTVQGAEYKTRPLILTYHRHAYGLGEHYNSTQLYEDSKDSD